MAIFGSTCNKIYRERQKPFEATAKKKKKKKNNIKIKIKSIKHNYKVPQRVYSSIYANIVEQFKIYVNSLMPDKIDEIEDNF